MTADTFIHLTSSIGILALSIGHFFLSRQLRDHEETEANLQAQITNLYSLYLRSKHDTGISEVAEDTKVAE